MKTVKIHEYFYTLNLKTDKDKCIFLHSLHRKCTNFMYIFTYFTLKNSKRHAYFYTLKDLYKHFQIKYGMLSFFFVMYTTLSHVKLSIKTTEMTVPHSLGKYHTVTTFRAQHLTVTILKNSIIDAHTPQPGEIFFNTMRYRSSETVHSLGYFQSTACKD